MPKHDTVHFVHFNPTTSIIFKTKVRTSFISSHISQSENSTSQYFIFYLVVDVQQLQTSEDHIAEEFSLQIK